MSIPLPNLSLTGGHASSSGSATTSGQSGTGPFNFKGSSATSNWTQMIIPGLIVVGALWLINRK